MSVDDIEKQVHDNGDTSLVSVQSGEAVLTPVQTDLFQKFTEKMPEMVQAFDMSDLVKVPNYIQELQALHPVQRDVNNVVNIDTLSLPNVQDYKTFKNDMFRDMQKSNNCKGFIKDVIGGL